MAFYYSWSCPTKIDTLFGEIEASQFDEFLWEVDIFVSHRVDKRDKKAVRVDFFLYLLLLLWVMRCLLLLLLVGARRRERR
jgi:hypothetical protein